MQAAVEYVRLALNDVAIASHVSEANDEVDNDWSQVLNQSVRSDSDSLPAATQAHPVHFVPDLSYEGSSETTAPARRGPPHDDIAGAPPPAAVPLRRHPPVPRVTRSVSQPSNQAAAPSDDHPPSKELP